MNVKLYSWTITFHKAQRQVFGEVVGLSPASSATIFEFNSEKLLKTVYIC